MRSLVFILLVGTMSFQAFAGGPVYSRYGVGDLAYFGSNRAFAIAVTGIALDGDGFINGFNPAGLSRISLTRISGGFQFSTMTLKDPTGSTKFARGDFQNVTFAVPVSQDHGITLFGGASPYSNVDYKVSVRTTTAASGSEQLFTGIGGLSTLSLGFSYRPREDLALGLKYSYVYGTIEQITKVTFDDPTFTNSELHVSRFHTGSLFTLGALVENVGSFLGSPSLDDFQFGAIIVTPAKLSVKEERILLTSTSADTSAILRGKTDLPFSWGIGMSYQAGERILITGDLFQQNWQGANFFGGSSVGIRNSTRIGAGAEFQPKRNPTSYGERVAYRTGFAYNSSYYSMNGQAVNEWFISGGVGLPFGPDARMDLTLQVGSNGTTNGGLQKINFVRFSLSVNASEAWFLTLEED